MRLQINKRGDYRIKRQSKPHGVEGGNDEHAPRSERKENFLKPSGVLRQKFRYGMQASILIDRRKELICALWLKMAFFGIKRPYECPPPREKICLRLKSHEGPAAALK